ncbi:MAG: hypothetical protein NWQ07_04085 [Flaviramulus sp.]|nr:hypothetical protein [Flaviramulus sp.]
MKHIVTLLTVLLISISSFAQQGIGYKAIIKDNLGNVVANQEITLRFSILDALTGGTIESQDYHYDVLTDANGIAIVNIGEGAQSLSYGFFEDIDWGSHSHFLRVEIDISGGTNFVDMGTTEFKAVPYAFQAQKVKNQAFKSEGGITANENSTDDFVFGSTQLDDTGNSSGISRMFFNKDKSSFRAGRALDNEWDDENIGNRSAAFGLNTIASGTYSLASGNRTLAQSQSSVAIGAYNVGGGNPTAWVGTDPLFEIGNGTATINTETRNNAFTVLKNGNIVLDGELNTTSTGNANMVPIAYGTIESNGTISSGSGNFNLAKDSSGPGVYIITINNEVWNSTDYITILTRITNTQGFILAQTPTAFNGGLFRIFTSNYNAVNQDCTFSFVVYKP